jgi:uncharacterized YccA/Bax inhibitor family protein
MRSGNPVLNPKTCDIAGADADPMTLGRTVNKSAMPLALVVITAVWTWGRYFTAQDPASIAPRMWGGVIGGLAFGLIVTLVWLYLGILRLLGKSRK